jgi:hypothetical protein
MQQTKYKEKMAPRAGFEPATDRLTADCSTAELPRNKTAGSLSSNLKSCLQVFFA